MTILACVQPPPPLRKKGGGGPSPPGGTPLYGLHKYVRPQRVWLFSRFGLK